MKPFMRKRLHAFGRAEDGIAAVEFTILFPCIFFMFLWAIELGLIMTKSVMLEFAVDTTMRELRTGNLVNPTSDRLKDAICRRARIVSRCRETIMLDLRPVNTNTWVLPSRTASCQNRDANIQPVVEYTVGQQNQIMLVRACVTVNTLFPNIGIGARLQKDSHDGFKMVAMSAFVNEPT